MAVRLLIGRAGAGKTWRCLEAIRAELARRPTDGSRLLFLVPEQAALQMERALLVDSPIAGLGRCDVLSFRRLARRVLNHVLGELPTPLTPTGRRMTLRAILAARKDELREFSGVALRAGFIDELARAVVELLQQAATAEGLEAAAASAEQRGDRAAARLHDVALIYRAYLDYLGDRRVDPEGVLDLARGRLDAAPWINGCRLWVDGFAGFTAQQSRLLVELARRASDVTLTLLSDPQHPMLSQPDSAVDELSLFARTVRTGRDVWRAFADAGVPVEPPELLGDAPLPRFRTASLSLLESHLFAGPPRDTTIKADGAIRMSAAADRRAEVLAAVREIRRLVTRPRDPLRYRDIALIVRDLEPYHELISAALREHDIPFFIDRRRPTRHHPLVELVRALLWLRVAGGNSGNAIPRLLKTGLSPIDDRQADLLENYQRAHGLDAAAAWHAGDWPWPADPGLDPEHRPPADVELVREINAARRRLLTALGDWWSPRIAPDATARAADVAPSPAPMAREWAKGIYECLERLGAPNRLAAWADAAAQRGDPDEAQEHVAVWTDLVALLDELVAALGDEPMTAPEFAEVIEAGLAEFNLGLVPPTIDQMLVSSIERSRHPPIRAAFLLGLADGQFPMLHQEDALLGDDERRMLSAGGVDLGPDRQARLLDERMLAYIAVTRPSEQLWVSYPTADENGRAMHPSPFWEQIRAALGTAAPPVETIEPPSADFRIGETSTIAQTAGRLALALREAAESGDATTASAGQALHAYERIRTLPDAEPVLRRALAGLRPPNPAELSAAAAQALHPPPWSISVSQLEVFAHCPYQHFARHALRLRQRPEHDVSPIRLGELYHRMLDEFVNGLIDGGEHLGELRRDDIVRRVGLVAEQAMTWWAGQTRVEPLAADQLLRRSQRELPEAITAQGRLAEPGLEPRRTEQPFGMTADVALPALELRTPGGRDVRIVGRIDRVDLLPTDTVPLAVVFDYKRTANRRLHLADVFHGLALQLVSYLLVLRDHGRQIDPRGVHPAGAFYLPLIAPLKGVAHPDEARDEDFDPLAAFQPRGVLDFDALMTLDPDVAEGTRSRRYAAFRKNDGEPGHVESTDVARRGEFDALLDHVRRKLSEFADELLDGRIAVQPVRVGTTLACHRCDYRGVCRFEYASGQAVQIADVSRGEVLQRVRVASDGPGAES